MVVRLLAFAAAAALSFTSAAWADTMWSMNASACVPSAQTIQSAGHSTGLGVVQHAPTKTGMISLNCPISLFSISVDTWRLRLTYADPSGRATTAAARAKIYRMGLTDGTPELLASVTSNMSTATEVNSALSKPFNHMFTFQENLYWVTIELSRNATDQAVTVYSVALEFAGT